MVENVAKIGPRFVQGLRELARERPEMSNVRGIGSLVSFTLPDADTRAEWIKKMREQHLLVLSCGPSSVRFRLPFVMTPAEIDTAMKRIAAAAPVKAKA